MQTSILKYLSKHCFRCFRENSLGKNTSRGRPDGVPEKRGRPSMVPYVIPRNESAVGRS